MLGLAGVGLHQLKSPLGSFLHMRKAQDMPPFLHLQLTQPIQTQECGQREGQV